PSAPRAESSNSQVQGRAGDLLGPDLDPVSGRSLFNSHADRHYLQNNAREAGAPADEGDLVGHRARLADTGENGINAAFSLQQRLQTRQTVGWFQHFRVKLAQRTERLAHLKYQAVPLDLHELTCLFHRDVAAGKQFVGLTLNDAVLFFVEQTP